MNNFNNVHKIPEPNNFNNVHKIPEPNNFNNVHKIPEPNIKIINNIQYEHVHTVVQVPPVVTIPTILPEIPVEQSNMTNQVAQAHTTQVVQTNHINPDYLPIPPAGKLKNKTGAVTRNRNIDVSMI